MALPLSGTVSMNDIRIELGIPTQSPFSLTSASTGSYVAINQCSTYKPNASAPYAISEWYGYCHTCACWSGALWSGTSCAEACLFTDPSTFYSDCYTPDVGCHFYSGPGLTNPVGDGFYSDGTYCYNVGDAPGYILSKTLCASPTPTPTVTITPTPTITQTPTNTPTPTPTSAATTYTVSVYVKLGNTTTENQSQFSVYYNKNSGSDVSLGNVNGVTTTCSLFNTFSVNANDSVDIGFKNNSTFLGYSFNVATSTTCPNNTPVYCGTRDTGDGQYYSYGSVTSNISIYVTLTVVSSKFVGCSI